MVKKIILIALPVAFLISSCKKSDERENYLVDYHLQDNLSGNVYLDCNQHPAINKQVTIKVSSLDYDVLDIATLATVATDSLGYFSYAVNYSVSSTTPPSYFFEVDSNYKIVDLPIISPINIITHDTAHVAINIVASNSYTASDTLYCKINDEPYYQLAGPFSSGVINIINVPQSFYISDSSQVNVFWAIGYRNLLDNYNPNAVFTSFAIKHITCNNSDTVNIKIN